MEVVIAHARDDVLPLSTFQPVPDDLQRVILRCLAKRPEVRPASLKVTQAPQASQP